MHNRTNLSLGSLLRTFLLSGQTTESEPDGLTTKRNQERDFSWLYNLLNGSTRDNNTEIDSDGLTSYGTGSTNTGSSAENNYNRFFFGDLVDNVSSFFQPVVDGFKAIGNFVRSAVSQVFGSANVNENASDSNTNCGPAVGVGALRALGLSSGDESTANDDIESFRTAMGLDPTNEETEETSTYQIARGAENSGAGYTNVYNGNASMRDLRSEISQGRQVIFRALNSEDNGHFMRVDHIEGNMAMVHDPLNPDGSLIPMSLDKVGGMMAKGGNHMVVIGNS